MCRFSDAWMTTLPRTPTAGVRKAPMDEIARGGGLLCGGRYEGLIGMATLMRSERSWRDEVDGDSKRVMAPGFWKQRPRTQPLGAGTDLE